MRRVISLYLPRWPSDRLRRKGKDALPRDKPLVTAIMEGQRRVVVSIDEAAERLGLIVEHAQDMTEELKLISCLDRTFPLVPGRGDEAKNGGHSPDSRDPKLKPIARARDIYEPDLHIETLKLKARNFR